MNKTIFGVNEKRPYFVPNGTKDDMLEVKRDGECSPYVLGVHVPSLKKEFTIMNILMASAVYEKGGPYVDLYGVPPILAAEDERTKTSGALLAYRFENETYPAIPDDLFLIWLVFLALRDSRLLSRKVCGYKNFSCAFDERVAKALCLYASLCANGLIRKIRTFSDLEQVLYTVSVSVSKEQMPKDVSNAPLTLQKGARKKAYAIGDWIMHPKLGKGEVVKKDAKTYTIFFKVSGPKTVQKEYVETQCRPL